MAAICAESSRCGLASSVVKLKLPCRPQVSPSCVARPYESAASSTDLTYKPSKILDPIPAIQHTVLMETDPRQCYADEDPDEPYITRATILVAVRPVNATTLIAGFLRNASRHQYAISDSALVTTNDRGAS